MNQVTAESTSTRASVLTRALLRASDSLGLSRKVLARVIGVSEASVSRLGRGRHLALDSKEGELARLFLRMYRSLDTLVGGDEAKARAWLHARNHHLEAVPAERIRSIAGLVDVVSYLDAMRGKL